MLNVDAALALNFVLLGVKTVPAIIFSKVQGKKERAKGNTDTHFKHPNIF